MRPLRISAPATTKMLTPTRQLIDKWLEEASVADDRWRLIATELLTNAINASQAQEPVELSLELRQGVVALAVTNAGVLADFPTTKSEAAMPTPDSARGRGLGLVHALVQQLDVHHSEGKTTVSCLHDVPFDSPSRNWMRS